MSRSMFSRISLMMFLEFFVWGAWYVTVPNYMAEIGMSDAIYWAFTVGPIGAIVSPFFLGMIADRFFPTEKVLGVMHLLGGVAIFCAPFVASGPWASSTVLFILLLLVHMLFYMPTIGLANTLAFHQITDQENQFPYIRVSGTIGWIVAGIFVSFVLGADDTALPLHVAGIAGILMGLYSFSLPHVPPPAKGEKASIREVLGLDALAYFTRSRSFNVFLISSLLICIPLSAYYAYAPLFVNAVDIPNPAFALSFGQWFEVAFILSMPFFFRRFGIKWMLISGMAAWGLRYGLFALGAPGSIFWLVMGGILLHGVAYDFFFVAGQIYVDKKSTPEIRGQGQGLIILVTYGVGMLIGAQVAGWIFNAIVTENIDQALELWQTFWIIPALFAVAVMVFFALTFREEKIVDDEQADRHLDIAAPAE